MRIRGPARRSTRQRTPNPHANGHHCRRDDDDDEEDSGWRALAYALAALRRRAGRLLRMLTCASVGLTCAAVVLTCAAVVLTCAAVGLTCAAVGLTCAAVGLRMLTCTATAVPTVRFPSPKEEQKTSSDHRH